jgi:hypothetical protein
MSDFIFETALSRAIFKIFFWIRSSRRAPVARKYFSAPRIAGATAAS